jgi:glycosyltransferase involved in cell wall biosynthesis
MRILHVPHAYAPVFGGVETQVRRVSECLAEMGHDVRVFTTDVPSVDGYYVPMAPIDAPPHELMNGVSVTRARFGSRPSRMTWTFLNGIPVRRGTGRAKGLIIDRAFSKLKEAFADYMLTWPPDVVVAMPHLVTNVQVVLSVRESMKFPLVMMPLLHEADPQWPHRTVKKALEAADAVLANTCWEAEKLCRDYDVPGDRVFVGGMGADSVDRDERVEDNGFTVTFLGRKSLLKGIPLLLDAMRIAWQTARDVDLILAGAETKDEANIRALVDALPAWQRGRVISVNNISEAAKHAILARSHLLALPSSNESFGGVIIEAWAHRVPVVTLDLPVFREIVSEGSDGFLSARTPQAFADCLLSGYRNPVKLRLMGEAGFRKVSSRYNWKDIAGRFLDACRFAVAAFQERSPSGSSARPSAAKCVSGWTKIQP